jgi:hypothetical protein
MNPQLAELFQLLFGGPRGYLFKYRIVTLPRPLLALFVTLLHWRLAVGHNGDMNSSSMSVKYSKYLRVYEGISAERWIQISRFYLRSDETSDESEDGSVCEIEAVEDE